MNALNFIISKEEKPRLDNLIKDFNPNVIISITARIDGFNVNLSALGGKQNELLEFVDRLGASGFVI
jgi:hypothetical protein